MLFIFADVALQCIWIVAWHCIQRILLTSGCVKPQKTWLTAACLALYCNVFNTLTPGSLSLWRMQWQCIGTQGANLAWGICAFLAWGFPRTWALTDLAPGARCSMIHLEWHTTYWVEWLWPICTVFCLPSYPLQNLTCMPKAQRHKSPRVLRL